MTTCKLFRDVGLVHKDECERLAKKGVMTGSMTRMYVLVIWDDLYKCETRKDSSYIIKYASCELPGIVEVMKRMRSTTSPFESAPYVITFIKKVIEKENVVILEEYMSQLFNIHGSVPPIKKTMVKREFKEPLFHAAFIRPSIKLMRFIAGSYRNAMFWEYGDVQGTINQNAFGEEVKRWMYDHEDEIRGKVEYRAEHKALILTMAFGLDFYINLEPYEMADMSKVDMWRILGEW